MYFDYCSFTLHLHDFPYFVELVHCYISQLQLGTKLSGPQANQLTKLLCFVFVLKMNSVIAQITFIDFILLSQPYDKTLRDAQSFSTVRSFNFSKKNCMQASLLPSENDRLLELSEIR